MKRGRVRVNSGVEREGGVTWAEGREADVKGVAGKKEKKTAEKIFFFFDDTAATEIYTLSLRDALPILNSSSRPSMRNGSDSG